MKEYKIGIFEEQGGYIVVKANNAEHANHIAQNILDDEGIDRKKVDVTHRDTYIVDWATEGQDD